MESKEMIFRVGQELAKADQLAETVTREAFAGKSCLKVLKELIAQIDEVDFRSKAHLDEDARVARKLYIVIAIDELISIAIKNNWGLCTKDDSIYVFNGKYWQVIDKGDFKAFLAETVLKMGVPEFDAKYFRFRDDLYEQFISSANLLTPEKQDKVLVNLLNGTFEITPTEQMLREPRREDFLKYQLAFEYDPQAQCPLFHKYLDRVLPDSDCQKVLAEYMGYIFVNNLKLEKVLILYGDGANGKSVFFDIANAVLGSENISSYSLESLTCEGKYQRAELPNKLLNYATEISVRLHTASFKLLVSGEPIEARKIYGSPFIMRDYAKLMFNCNDLPRDIEQNEAYFRRFLVLPFNQRIPESEQDPELARKIIGGELSGIFNWILDGLERILTQKRFTHSNLMDQQLEVYRRESDSVAMFLHETERKPSIEHWQSLKSLYHDYFEYCRGCGFKICSRRTFSNRIRKQGFTSERRSQGTIVFVEKIKS